MIVAVRRIAAAAAGLVLAGWAACAPAAGIDVVDDLGVPLTLGRPAGRIVSLSPGHTELLFAAGAGDRVVGVVETSDFPDQARQLPRVGNSAQVDVERILALRPEVVIAWPHGAGQRQAGQIRRLGVPVFTSDPRSLEAIATTLVMLGRIAGSETRAQLAARAFRARLDALRATYANRAPLSVFMQIASTPLMTVGRQHVFTDALHVCGGRNAMGDIGQAAGTVSRETVIAADPDAIVTLGSESRTLGPWRALPAVRAVREDRLVALDSPLLSVLSPRTLDGVTLLCERLDALRRPRATVR